MAATQEYKLEEYNNDLAYRYVLSDGEKKVLSSITHDVLHNFKGPAGSIAYVKSKLGDVSNILQALDKFFLEHPGNFFLRLSTCSPKDAYYQLYRDTPESDEESEDDEPMTINDIKRDLEVLKVNSAEQVLLVLTHSERMYFDFEFKESELAICLLPWQDDFSHDCETRCFIKGGVLIGFSQYYCDLANGYSGVDNYEVFYSQVIDFIKELQQGGRIPYDDAVVDITLDSGKKLMFIEINGFNIGTDSCLFEWDELMKVDEKKISGPVFKYKANGTVISMS